MEEHNFTSKEIEEFQKIQESNKSDSNVELQKLQLQLQTEIEKERIKANNISDFKNMLKEGIITFEQFKECVGMC